MDEKLAALLEKLRNDLPSLMRAWEPSDREADYKCAFCHMRSRTNQGEVNHEPGCLGEELAKGLP